MIISMIKIPVLLLCIITLTTSFYIQVQPKLNHYTPILSSPQRGNISLEEQTTIKKAIDDALTYYDDNEFNKIAKNISQVITSLLKNYTWSAFVYDKGVKQIAVPANFFGSKKFISIINYGKYNMSFSVFGTSLGFSCYQYGGGGNATFGESVNATNQQKIKAIVDNSIIYRGDDIQSAVQYISDKVDGAVFYNGFAVIANPTTAFGFYVCRRGEDWASLREYGALKWNYYILNI